MAETALRLHPHRLLRFRLPPLLLSLHHRLRTLPHHHQRHKQDPWPAAVEMVGSAPVRVSVAFRRFLLALGLGCLEGCQVCLRSGVKPCDRRLTALDYRSGTLFISHSPVQADRGMDKTGRGRGALASHLFSWVSGCRIRFPDHSHHAI